ncbi:uncharacterized protein TNCV_2877361 [Trichonephila clavipes]|uniref:Uncharacterized protein n=1 Tax=Trichonephila clavipes TaxID=2585209 RepID=A0A8X7BJS3_TRICX|nr:uncharacterized protein TNCV_2877361 [Trichonephila clavipes]
MVRDVTERSVSAIHTICLSSREVVHGDGCDRPRLSVVPSCIQRSPIRITVVWFCLTRLQNFLKYYPQSRKAVSIPSHDKTSPIFSVYRSQCTIRSRGSS